MNTKEKIHRTDLGIFKNQSMIIYYKIIMQTITIGKKTQNKQNPGRQPMPFIFFKKLYNSLPQKESPFKSIAQISHPKPIVLSWSLSDNRFPRTKNLPG